MLCNLPSRVSSRGLPDEIRDKGRWARSVTPVQEMRPSVSLAIMMMLGIAARRFVVVSQKVACAVACRHHAYLLCCVHSMRLDRVLFSFSSLRFIVVCFSRMTAQTFFRVQNVVTPRCRRMVSALLINILPCRWYLASPPTSRTHDRSCHARARRDMPRKST